MTRAHFALLHGNFREAFRMHPLFPIAIPGLFILLHNKALGFGLSRRAMNILGFSMLFIFIAVYLVRLLVLHDPVLMPDFDASLIGRLLNLSRP